MDFGLLHIRKIGYFSSIEHFLNAFTIFCHCFIFLGPGGLPESVSFELQDYRGYYLRNYAQFAYFDAANTSRGSLTYLQDVNFALR